MRVLARATCRDLERRGIRLRRAGAKLIVDAPQGTLTPEVRHFLTANKQLILNKLDQEERLAVLTISEFAAQDAALELAVSWFDETIWFVPRAEHAAILVRAGLGRGRIFTVDELTNPTIVLVCGQGLVPDLMRITQLKVGLNAEIIDAIEETEEPEPAIDPACQACRRTRFWRSIHGVIVCGICHPPAAPNLVAEWVASDPPDGSTEND